MRGALLLLGCLLTTGCLGVPASDAPPSTGMPTPCEWVSFTNLLGVIGEAGYNETWEPDLVRERLEAAGFALAGAEHGVRGVEPGGRNFTFRETGEPRQRLTVDFESGTSVPYTEEEAARQWALVQEEFSAAVARFEDATGYSHVTYGHLPLAVSGTGCR